jgi:flagellar biogenesis protein FliO
MLNEEMRELMWILMGLGIMFFVTILIGRKIAQEMREHNKSLYIRVLDVMPLSRSNSIYLVKVGSENMALSISATGARAISIVKEREFIGAKEKAASPLSQNVISRFFAPAKPGTVWGQDSLTNIIVPRQYEEDEDNTCDVQGLQGRILNVSQKIKPHPEKGVKAEYVFETVNRGEEEELPKNVRDFSSIYNSLDNLYQDTDDFEYAEEVQHIAPPVTEGYDAPNAQNVYGNVYSVSAIMSPEVVQPKNNAHIQIGSQLFATTNSVNNSGNFATEPYNVIPKSYDTTEVIVGEPRGIDSNEDEIQNMDKVTEFVIEPAMLYQGVLEFEPSDVYAKSKTVDSLNNIKAAVVLIEPEGDEAEELGEQPASEIEPQSSQTQVLQQQMPQQKILQVEEKFEPLPQFVAVEQDNLGEKTYKTVMNPTEDITKFVVPSIKPLEYKQEFVIEKTDETVVIEQKEPSVVTKNVEYNVLPTTNIGYNSGNGYTNSTIDDIDNELSSLRAKIAKRREALKKPNEK